jgi:hypothetical protein
LLSVLTTTQAGERDGRRIRVTAAALWLPSQLVCDISVCLAKGANPKTPQQILVDIRKSFLHDEKDALIPDNILYKPPGRA